MPKQKNLNAPADKSESRRSPLAWFLNYCFLHQLKPATLSFIFGLIALLIIFVIILSITTVTSITSRPVKFGLENIGELATQSGYYTNVQVIDSSREVFGLDIPFTQKKCIFSYDGIIKAGIDFGDIKLTVNEISHTIRVDLPEIRITSNQIDPDSLQIYDESSNVFNPLKLDDVNQSLIALQEEAEVTAIANGLLENAQQNAETLIRCFLQGIYDLDVYTIEFV